MHSRRVDQSPMKAPVLYDKWLIFLVMCLAGIGLIMMTSASIVISDDRLHQPFYYLFKQLVFLTVGVILGSVVLRIETKNWESISIYLLFLTVLLLSLVLVPGIGHRAHGSARWLGYGSLTFQISELAKLSIIIYFAGYLVRRLDEVRTKISGFLKPLIILGVVAGLLLCEPDFGATVVIAATCFAMLFLAGMQLRLFALLFGFAVGGLAWIAVQAPYRLARLTSFLNPWANPFDSGYQLTQSLIAFGRGGWFGVGLGKSIQKMYYLPEAHTDFLFAVIAEEWGLIGMLAIITLFLLLVTRVFMIGKRAEQLGRQFAGWLAYGLGTWIAIQFIVSIGVNVGLLPTKGLTLPLMSYGGSSLLVNCVMIALLIRIDHENRIFTMGIKRNT